MYCLKCMKLIPGSISCKPRKQDACLLAPHASHKLYLKFCFYMLLTDEIFVKFSLEMIDFDCLLILHRQLYSCSSCSVRMQAQVLDLNGKIESVNRERKYHQVIQKIFPCHHSTRAHDGWGEGGRKRRRAAPAFLI